MKRQGDELRQSRRSSSGREGREKGLLKASERRRIGRKIGMTCQTRKSIEHFPSNLRPPGTYLKPAVSSAVMPSAAQALLDA